MLQQRQPIAVILNTPTGEMGKLSRSEVLRELDAHLSANTDLYAVEIEGASVKSCRGDLLCVASAVRPDLQPGQGVRSIAPEMVERPLTKARYLLVLSNLARPDRADRIAALLFDMVRANAIATATAAPAEGSDAHDEWRYQIDQEVKRKATVELDWAEAPDQTALRLYFERVLTIELRARFLATGNWKPFGALEITVDVPEMGIRIDDRLMGVTQRGTTRIMQVPSGAHRVRLEHPDFEDFETEVQVVQGQTASLLPQLILGQSVMSRSVHSAMFWGGGALALAGTALTIAAVVQSGASDQYSCASEPGGRCSAAFVRLGDGPLTAPLGYSLLALGGTSLLGEQLTDDANVPWIALAIGVAAGVGAYAISEAAQPEGLR